MPGAAVANVMSTHAPQSMAVVIHSWRVKDQVFEEVIRSDHIELLVWHAERTEQCLKFSAIEVTMYSQGA